MRRAKGILPLDLFQRVVAEYVALGGTQIGLTPIAGDPFVDKRVLDRLDCIADRPEIRLCHLFTNAMALDPETADAVLDRGMNLSINVSFGGFDAETYKQMMGVDRFDAVVAHLNHLIARKEELGSKLSLSISVRAPEHTFAGPVFEEFLAHHRAGRLELTWVSEFDCWAGAIQPEVLESAGLTARVPPERQGVCYWLLTAPAVLVDGRVNACSCRDVEARLVIGDLRRESLADILAGARLRELACRQERGDYPGVCRRCTLYSPIRLRWMLARNFPSEAQVPQTVPGPSDKSL
jgi:hypothetical protein